jgi:hypothetical protein
MSKQRVTQTDWIRLSVNLPQHEKIEALSDRAFRLLIESWCYCGAQLTDGRIGAAKWRRMGSLRSRNELAVTGLLHEQEDGSVVMHDYLEWQRSRAEVLAERSRKSDGAAKGNHVKWHVNRGITDPDCRWCERQDDSDSESDMRSDERVADAIAGPIAEERRGEERREEWLGSGTNSPRAEDRSGSAEIHPESAARSALRLIPRTCPEHRTEMSKGGVCTSCAADRLAGVAVQA